MQKPAAPLIDWFIPDALAIAPSDLGKARNFVVNQFIGPVLLQPIAIFLFILEPNPGLGFWSIVGCISAFWLMPLGLKFTKNFRLVSFVSVELLCCVSLLGAFCYGGMTSPFLPWLLVSLMLGFFYLPDQALLVILLFAGNIAVTVGAYLMTGMQQHIPVSALSNVTWFSMFSATAYMSRMAIYYANIITMTSDLDRSIDLHRKRAQDLAERVQAVEAENRSKAVFLERIGRQVDVPVTFVIEQSRQLLARGDALPEERSDIHKINEAGRLLQAAFADVLVAEGSDPSEQGADKALPTPSVRPRATMSQPAEGSAA